LFRLYRWLRFRGLDDEAIASSLKQSIEQEALVSALAAGDGIRTPRLLAVTEIDADRLALAFVRIGGSSLDGVPAERLTDKVLRGIWRLVADLHRAGIAHRDLRLANLFLDDDGQAWLIDFGFGTVVALPGQLAGAGQAAAGHRGRRRGGREDQVPAAGAGPAPPGPHGGGHRPGGLLPHPPGHPDQGPAGRPRPDGLALGGPGPGRLGPDLCRGRAET
jgi:Protein kinase domain